MATVKNYHRVKADDQSVEQISQYVSIKGPGQAYFFDMAEVSHYQVHGLEGWMYYDAERTRRDLTQPRLEITLKGRVSPIQVSGPLAEELQVKLDEYFSEKIKRVG